MLPKTLLLVLLLSGSAFAAAPKSNHRDFASIPPAQRLKTICALAKDIAPSLKAQKAYEGIAIEFEDIQFLACASHRQSSN